ncbi:MAG: hypothetical protein ACN6QR_17130, partial [Pseudomonas protegens]
MAPAQTCSAATDEPGRAPIAQRPRNIVLRPFCSLQEAPMTYTRAQLQYRLYIAAGALLFTGALISTFFSTL